MASHDEQRAERDAQVAVELDREIGAEHIGNVYAEALLEAAQGEGKTDEVLDQFDSFVTQILDAYPEFDRLLVSEMISHEEKSAVLDRILARQALPVFVNFLKVVSRHGRLRFLRAIHRQAHALHEKNLGRVAVEVTTAAPLEASAAQRLKSALQTLVDGEPVLTSRTDPKLIGGMVVRVGDTIYDASVAKQFEIMRQKMIDRSVHEIQSRRDRFRHPAGN